jgi:anti-anti-sigma factor
VVTHIPAFTSFYIRIDDTWNFPSSISVDVVRDCEVPVMLTVDVEKTGDVAVVRCSGRIVRGREVQTLRNAVVSEKDSRIVVLDLSEVAMVDAGGLTTLVCLHEWARSRGIQLKLVNPSHFVHEVLTRTKLDRVLDISTLANALFVLSGAECQHMRYAASC